MKQPWWKRWLSYFYEFNIESTSSKYNPLLYVSLRRGRYQLCTANAVYSFGDLYDNFSSTFEKIKLDELAIKEVLILGFGLGSIPLILEHSFKKNYRYTAIEIDEEVLYLANKYALPDINSPIELVCTDAVHYVMQSTRTFDMIAVDVFLDDVVPDAVEQDQFLQKLQILLSPKGILLYNRLAYTKADIKNAQQFYNQKFKPNFPKGTYLEVKGNWMLMNRADIIK